MYRVHLFAPTANRTEFQEIVQAITKHSNSGVMASGNDYNSSSGNKVQVALALNEDGLTRARAMRLYKPYIKWVVRTIGKVVLESDISTITVGQRVTCSAIRTAMQGTYTTSDVGAVGAGDGNTSFGHSITLRQQGDFTAYTPTHQDNVFVDGEGSNEVICLAIKQQGGTWCGADVAYPGVGYGYYRFVVANRVDSWDAPVVHAGWTWAEEQPYPREEIDIFEAGQNLASPGDAQHVVWYLDGNQQNQPDLTRFEMSGKYFTVWECWWTPASIRCKCTDDDGVVLSDWTSSYTLTPVTALFRFNAWVQGYSGGTRPTNESRCVYYGLQIPLR